MSHLHAQLSTQTLLATLWLLNLFFSSHLCGQSVGRPLPCSVVFRGKFLFSGWWDKHRSISNGFHMGLKYILCSCLDSHAVFQAPCWDWCNCRSLGGHSHARVCEALALEKTLLPIAAPGLYCWLNLTASRQTCPPQWMAAHHCSSSSGCFSGWKICGARIPATQNTEWMGPRALFLFTSVRWVGGVELMCVVGLFHSWAWNLESWKMYIVFTWTVYDFLLHCSPLSPSSMIFFFPLRKK